MGAQEAREGGNEVQNDLQAPGSWVTGGRVEGKSPAVKAGTYLASVQLLLSSPVSWWGKGADMGPIASAERRVSGTMKKVHVRV